MGKIRKKDLEKQSSVLMIIIACGLLFVMFCFLGVINSKSTYSATTYVCPSGTVFVNAVEGCCPVGYQTLGLGGKCCTTSTYESSIECNQDGTSYCELYKGYYIGYFCVNSQTPSVVNNQCYKCSDFSANYYEYVWSSSKTNACSIFGTCTSSKNCILENDLTSQSKCVGSGKLEEDGSDDDDNDYLEKGCFKCSNVSENYYQYVWTSTETNACNTFGLCTNGGTCSIRSDIVESECVGSGKIEEDSSDDEDINNDDENKACYKCISSFDNDNSCEYNWIQTNKYIWGTSSYVLNLEDAIECELTSVKEENCKGEEKKCVPYLDPDYYYCSNKLVDCQENAYNCIPRFVIGSDTGVVFKYCGTKKEEEDNPDDEDEEDDKNKACYKCMSSYDRDYSCDSGWIHTNKFYWGTSSYVDNLEEISFCELTSVKEENCKGEEKKCVPYKDLDYYYCSDKLVDCQKRADNCAWEFMHTIGMDGPNYQYCGTKKEDPGEGCYECLSFIEDNTCSTGFKPIDVYSWSTSIPHSNCYLTDRDKDECGSWGYGGYSCIQDEKVEYYCSNSLEECKNNAYSCYNKFVVDSAGEVVSKYCGYSSPSSSGGSSSDGGSSSGNGDSSDGGSSSGNGDSSGNNSKHTITFKNKEGNKIFATCVTDSSGKLDSTCLSKLKSKCNKWVFNFNEDASFDVDINTSSIFSGNTTCYCSNEVNVDENPKTSSIVIFIIFVGGFCAIICSIWYYRNINGSKQ